VFSPLDTIAEESLDLFSTFHPSAFLDPQVKYLLINNLSPYTQIRHITQHSS
jgi:hypothetical protein